MILRSLTKHVKDQNWFAVVIDFGIVVVGVFIGIQVANWNDERSEQRRDTALLVRLQTDFERIVEFGERITPRVTAQPVSTHKLINAIRSDAKFALDEDGTGSLISAVEAWAPYDNSLAYQEMTEAGTLSRITNPELREALNSYRRAMHADNQLSRYQRELSSKGVIERAVQFNNPPSSLTREVVSFDWEALKETEAHLQVVLNLQNLRSTWSQRSLVSAQRVLKLVNRELVSEAL
ncbi:hypothetical protein R0135_01255 [Congregibacter variabilis]|uniref:Uncharacterized protein n=1 Tax=Congregibacter variabilis TaxID=3081200 RepID=A0ABZ0I5P8_9GAMM|nr:hypothetical protein R0135_01255 [Congregibacter sp. IMCC43200]